MSPMGDMPINEAQARELGTLARAVAATLKTFTWTGVFQGWPDLIPLMGKVKKAKKSPLLHKYSSGESAATSARSSAFASPTF